MKLNYYLWNQIKDQPIESTKLVLLHGMGGTGALWRPIAASLENEMEILAFDQRGHGKSRWQQNPLDPEVPTYTPLDYGKDIVETLLAKAFYPVWMIGHSMGVRSAVAAAYLKPEWFRGLVLVDLGFSGAAGGGLGESLAQFIQILPQHFHSREEAKEIMTSHCPDPAIVQYLLAVSHRNELGHVTFPFDHEALIRTLEATRNSSIRPWLVELAGRGMPILILRGKKSLVWSSEEFLQEAKNFSKFASVQFHQVDNAGHGLPFEQKAAFIDLVKNFISNFKNLERVD